MYSTAIQLSSYLILNTLACPLGLEIFRKGSVFWYLQRLQISTLHLPESRVTHPVEAPFVCVVNSRCCRPASHTPASYSQNNYPRTHLCSVYWSQLTPQILQTWPSWVLKQKPVSRVINHPQSAPPTKRVLTKRWASLTFEALWENRDSHHPEPMMILNLTLFLVFQKVQSRGRVLPPLNSDGSQCEGTSGTNSKCLLWNCFHPTKQWSQNI